MNKFALWCIAYTAFGSFFYGEYCPSNFQASELVFVWSSFVALLLEHSSRVKEGSSLFRPS
jgi:hypothetical protein